jgi:hypothetical protein
VENRLYRGKRALRDHMADPASHTPHMAAETPRAELAGAEAEKQGRICHESV